MLKAIFSHGNTRKDAEEKQKIRNNHVKVGGCATSIELKKIQHTYISQYSFIFFPCFSVDSVAKNAFSF